jgi:transposase
MHEQAIQREVILGVDTHLDLHVGAVIDCTGKLLGTLAMATTASGYLQLIAWARSLGCFRRAGVEGTGTYGAGLARALREQGVEVLEVNRPDRSKRRRVGKSDPTDAESAARSVLSGQATAVPKSHNGVAETLRILSVARRSAVKAKTQAINQLRAILVSAPDEIRNRLWKTKAEQCVAVCADLGQLGTTTHLIALTSTLRLLAKRWLMLRTELKELESELEQLTLQFAPNLRKQFGVGPLTAATLIVAAGDNPERLRSEAALAALCGVNP